MHHWKTLLRPFLLCLFAVGLPAPLFAATISKNYTFTSGTTASASQVNSNFDQLYSESNSQESRISALEAMPPVSAIMFMDEATTLAGTLTTIVDTGQIYNYYTTNGAGGANGDSFSLNTFLKSGSYTLYVTGIVFTNRGTIDWYIDNTLMASQDWYSAGLAYNTTKSSAITVSSSGPHTLKAVVNGHNGASSGFAFAFTKIWIK